MPFPESQNEVLSPSEARAVLDLYHLRKRLADDAGGWVTLSELADVMGTSPLEAASLLRQVRSVLPSALMASAERVGQAEAEAVIGLHAEMTSVDEEPARVGAVASRLGVAVETIRPLVSVARDRTALGRSALHAGQTPPSVIEDFGVVIGENPRSWQIMWAVLALLGTLLLVPMLLAR